MQSIKLSERLKKEYSKIFATRRRIERIDDGEKVYLANKDLDIFYEGMFLKSVTLFEAYIEELFIGLLYDKYKLDTTKKVQKILFPNRKLAVNYLRNGKSYLDLLPYDKLAKTAKIHFKMDNPFLKLSKDSRKLIEETFVIRNAIAHSSFMASTKFKEFINNKHNTLPKKDRTPTRFLQSLNNSSQTMFEIYIIELNVLANSIASFS
jgi:hypothetical protein